MPFLQRRLREVLAGNLLFGAFLVNHALFYYGVLVLHRPLFSYQLTNPWVTIPANVLTVGWYYAIRQGKRWAAWLLLVLVGVALAHSLFPHRRAVLLEWAAVDQYTCEFGASAQRCFRQGLRWCGSAG